MYPTLAFALVTSVLIATPLWLLRRRLNIQLKLIALSALIGLGSILAVASVATHRSTQALLEQSQQNLQAVTAARKGQIENYFNFIHEQLINFAGNQSTAEATHHFTQAFASLAQETNLDPAAQKTIEASVKGYYESEFAPRARDNGLTYRGAAAYLPKSTTGLILQAWYLSDNRFDVGNKLALDRAPAASIYNTHHARFHPQIRRFLESFGYYDIFLFDNDGNLVYSVFKETDFATNFVTGPYAQTSFGDVVRRALASSTPGEVFVEDFDRYEPSYGSPAAFFGSPVFLEGRRIGCAVFQAPVDNLNAIMAETAGLGDTGQARLVGGDRLLRSQDRFSTNPTILRSKLEGPEVEAMLRGESGAAIKHNDEPAEVLAFAPLEIDGLTWGLITTMALEEVTAPARALQAQLMLLGLGLALLAGGIAWYFSRRLIRPIKPLLQRAREIARGDLAGPALPRQSHDELGQLTDSVNEMSASLRGLIETVSQTSSEVAAASTQIAASSDEVARGMGEQSAQVHQVSSAVEEMSASIVEVARKSAEAAGSADHSGRLAGEGGEVVRQTIEGMNAISLAVSASAVSVAELGKRGQQIGEIIAVIDDIAEQTNLLALNAAIEAARAGEHGRGFAVVADEVRKLADRTTQATQEISQSIQAIQVGTDEAVQRMNTGTDEVATGMTRAGSAGQSLEQIVTAARDVAGMIQSIAAAAEQQSQASEEVARSVETISEVSRQTADGVQQAASAAGSLSEKAERLRALCSRFTL